MDFFEMFCCCELHMTFFKNFRYRTLRFRNNNKKREKNMKTGISFLPQTWYLCTCGKAGEDQQWQENNIKTQDIFKIFLQRQWSKYVSKVSAWIDVHLQIIIDFDWLIWITLRITFMVFSCCYTVYEFRGPGDKEYGKFKGRWIVRLGEGH